MYSRPPFAASSQPGSLVHHPRHMPVCCAAAVRRSGSAPNRASFHSRDTRLAQVQQYSTKLGKLSASPQGNDAAPVSASNIPGFNREQELQSLDALCSSPLRAITVILGPRSTGKSALLKQYIRSRGLGSKCYIDARSTSVATPDALARALLELGIPRVAWQVQRLFPAAKTLAQTVSKSIEAFPDKQQVGDSEMVISSKAVSAVLAALTGERDVDPPLAAVIHAYRAVLDAWEQAKARGQLDDSSPPLLVLDEANVFMTWSEHHASELQELLRFFVSISKADNRSHVIMATSEYAFSSWLSQAIGPGFYTTFVIGDLLPAHARAFLNQHLQLLRKAEVSDDEWAAIHQVCGGNAGALGQVASLFSVFNDWPQALIQVSKDVARTLQPGYEPPPMSSYTAAYFATAVKAILDSPHKAVDEEELRTQLGGLAPLHAMVKANLLALRPFSSWAHDIPAEASGSDRLATLITAPSVVHLHLMKVQRRRLLKALDAQEGAATSAQQRLGSSSALEARQVRQQIKEVEEEIKEVVLTSSSQGFRRQY